MNTQTEINYNRIAKAIEYIKLNFKTQPDLEEIAKQVQMSPFHLQRLFKDWAGVSPKKFLQYLSVEYAKNILKKHNSTVFEAAYQTGLSGTGRLHDLFIKIEGMTPGEFKDGGKNLSINYSYAESPFGKIIVASTLKGICYMAFWETAENAFSELHKIFPKAQYQQKTDLLQQNALGIFKKNGDEIGQIKLHLKGTVFQLKIWNALLKIPLGQLASYGEIAFSIKNPQAARATGSAIGANPVSFLIPCHRIIQSTGLTGQYHWGSTRKAAILGWEAAKANLST